MAPLMKFFLRGTVAAVLALACAAPVAQAANVTVRIEGRDATLLPETVVNIDGTGVPGLGCPGTAAEAIDKATNGNWQRATFFDTVLGEQQVFTFADPQYWAQWHNGTYGAGVCTDLAKEGDEVLLIADLSDPVTFGPTVLPTFLTGVPAAGITLGDSITVKAEEIASTGIPGNGTRQPLAGATVTAGGATATTGADGTATLTPTAEGTFDVRAVKGRQRSPVRKLPVGAKAIAEAQAQAAATPSGPCTTSGSDGRCGTRDRLAPFATLAGLKDKQVFPAGKGPRALSGTLAADPSGILMVKLRIHRRAGESCSYFSGRQERFRKVRCGVANAKWFKIGDRADWSYLLPSRLPKGEYVIDVNAIDKAYNRDDSRTRGRNRVFISVG